MPKIMNLHHTKGQLPDGAIYVGRPGIWGNPYKIGEYSKELYRKMTRDDVVLMFELQISEHLKVLAKKELKGFDLACWCAPAKCHAEVWIRIANE